MALRENEFEAPGFENPTPEEVSQIVRDSGTIYDWGGITIAKISPHVVVKFGVHVTIGEATQMQFVNQHAASFPVPQIYGYYRYGPLPRDAEQSGGLFDTYIFMSFIEGETLEKTWESYDSAAKSSIAAQLRAHMKELRAIPSEGYIGSVPRDIVRDFILERAPARGPFDSEEEFNTAMVDVHQRIIPKAHMRKFFTGMLTVQKHRIVFAHGDLRQANIMVKDGKVTGIVDWELSGWYPEYWDFARAFYTWRFRNDWTDYLLEVLDPYYSEYNAYASLSEHVW